MSNLIYECWREPGEAFGTGPLERVAERITPSLIAGYRPRSTAGAGESLCITGPSGAAGCSGTSAHVGVFTGAWPDWHRPGSPVPDGSFALIRSDGETTELCSDDAGTRTLWYVFTERCLFASTSQRALVCLLGSLSWNRSAFAWFLSSGTLGPGDAWDSRIHRLPRGARLVLDRRSWALRLHTVPVAFEAQEMGEAEGRKGLREVLWKAIGGCDFRSSRWILPLSGGYDSRLLLTALYEQGLRPRTVTWGLAASRIQRGNDAYVAKQLAEIYRLPNDYLLTEMAEASPREVVDTFLSAHGGTTDEMFPYLDGLRLWSRFVAEGLDGIIRGDEGFGVDPRPEAYHRVALGLITLREILDEDTAGLISDGRQEIPEELRRRPAESVQTYGDRLVHAYFLPVVLAALTDVKAPFVEVANPLLTGSVLAFVRRMPDRMRAKRSLFERLTETASPQIPFATAAADDNHSDYLSSAPFRTWMAEELQDRFAERILPAGFRENLLASLRGGSFSAMGSRSMRTALKRVIPESWVIAARSWRRPDLPHERLLAFRCALASRIATLLGEDAGLLQRQGPPRSQEAAG